MSDFLLTLGGVVFQDFEIPPAMAAGGAQALFTHKYPGGARTVDTMGPDDDPITWAGWFEGPQALQRCQQIDTMRRQGAAVVLVWSAYRYLVVIRTFKWRFERYYHIGYDLALEVVQDLNNPVTTGSASADQQIANDVGDAGADAAALAAGIAPP